jgi:hypothetical protein
MVCLPAVTSAQRTPADATDHQRVHSLYEKGARAYDLGQYDAAILLFKEAYALGHAPSLLYNIAQSYRQMGSPRCKDAQTYYEAYLRERPQASDRPLLERRIAEMRSCAERSPPQPAPQLPTSDLSPVGAAPQAVPSVAPQAVPPPDSDRRASPRLSLALAGTGLAFLIGGGITYYAAGVRFDTLQHECPCMRDRWETWRDVETMSLVLMGVGAAATAAGTIWWFHGRGERSHGGSAWVAPIPGGAAVGATF